MELGSDQRVMEENQVSVKAGDESYDPFPQAQLGLDAAVRHHLEDEAAQIDAAGMMIDLFARLDREAVASAETVRRTPTRRWLALPAAVAALLAASLLLAIFLTGPSRAFAASPAAAVRSARTVHTGETVRCYTVTHTGPVRLFAAQWERQPTLSVRGGSFQLCFSGGPLTWGRDGSGRIWVAVSRKEAACFEPDELPERLREFVAIRGLELPELLDEVLSDFDLSWQDEDPSTRTVIATRRHPARPLQIESAEIRLAQGSDLIEQLTLVRPTLREGALATAFTLEREAPAQAAAFSAEAHLESGGEVFDGRQPFKRLLVLIAAFREAMSKDW